MLSFPFSVFSLAELLLPLLELLSELFLLLFLLELPVPELLLFEPLPALLELLLLSELLFSSLEPLFCVFAALLPELFSAVVVLSLPELLPEAAWD